MYAQVKWLDRLYQGFQTSMIGFLVLGLTGCQGGILDPKGTVGEQEKYLIFLALGLMGLVAIPTIGLTLWVAFRYRAKSSQPDDIRSHVVRDPHFEHHAWIEFWVWTIPSLIILVLGYVTWQSTHHLDPYEPLSVQTQSPFEGHTPSVTQQVKPLTVQVVSMDWKWLFIYPSLGRASVGKLVIPAGRTIHFELTSTSVMNSFFIPQLGSQIYTMSGMTTSLYVQAHEPGMLWAQSSQFSGAGFSSMHVPVEVLSATDFEKWTQTSEPVWSGSILDELLTPGTSSAHVWNQVPTHLFDQLVMLHASPAPMMMKDQTPSPQTHTMAMP